MLQKLNWIDMYEQLLYCFVYETDPSKDTNLILDGKKVIVPQGEPIPQPGYEGSNFDQSEYLVYKESQNRIRYMLMIYDEDEWESY